MRGSRHADARVAEVLKLISEKGSEKIARFAFEYARSERAYQGGVRTDQGEHHGAVRGHAEAGVRTRRAGLPRAESWHVIVDTPRTSSSSGPSSST